MILFKKRWQESHRLGFKAGYQAGQHAIKSKAKKMLEADIAAIKDCYEKYNDPNDLLEVYVASETMRIIDSIQIEKLE